MLEKKTLLKNYFKNVIEINPDTIGNHDKTKGR